MYLRLAVPLLICGATLTNTCVTAKASALIFKYRDALTSGDGVINLSDSLLATDGTFYIRSGEFTGRTFLLLYSPDQVNGLVSAAGFEYDNAVFPYLREHLDSFGLLFTSNLDEINFQAVGAKTYSLNTYNGQIDLGSSPGAFLIGEEVNHVPDTLPLPTAAVVLGVGASLLRSRRLKLIE